MEYLGRTLMLVGAGIAVLGAVFWLFGKVDYRGLPGDIKYESENVKLYLPLGSSIAISIVLSLGLWLWHYFQKK